MQEKELFKVAERLGKEKVREMDRKKKATEKLRKANERSQNTFSELISPYSELVTRNRKLYTRVAELIQYEPKAKEVNKIHGQTSIGKTLYVIIGEAPITEATPHHTAVCRVHSDINKTSGHRGEIHKSLFFEYLFINQEHIPNIQNDPYATAHGYIKDSGDIVHGPREDAPDVSAGAKKEDEIYRSGAGIVTDLQRRAGIKRLKAVVRWHSEQRHFGSQIEELEKSLDMLEQAAADPDLNPVLAERLGPSLSGNQQSLEA